MLHRKQWKVYNYYSLVKVSMVHLFQLFENIFFVSLHTPMYNFMMLILCIPKEKKKKTPTPPLWSFPSLNQAFSFYTMFYVI